MDWFCVNELLPENCNLCHFYKETNMKFTTVLVMNKHGQMEIKNRIKVDKCGRPYLDEIATDGWIWSEGGIKPKYWLPIPKNRKFLKRSEREDRKAT